jgi:hypothetical protein
MRLRRFDSRESPPGGGLFLHDFVVPCREGEWLAALTVRVFSRLPVERKLTGRIDIVEEG